MLTAQTILRKTDLGRAAITERGVSLSRAERNVLVLTDGKRSLNEVMLMTGVQDVTVFDHLVTLGMLEATQAAAASASAAVRSAAASSAAATKASTPDVPELNKPMPPLLRDNPFERIYSFLNLQIPEFMGITAFTLTLSLEKASTLDDLEPVKQKLLAVIEKKRGKAVADLYRARFDALARD